MPLNLLVDEEAENGWIRRGGKRACLGQGGVSTIACGLVVLQGVPGGAGGSTLVQVWEQGVGPHQDGPQFPPD